MLGPQRAGQLCALVARRVPAPQVPTPHARCLSAPRGGFPHPRHSPGVSSRPLRAAATGLAHPRGGARRRDVRAENEHGASAPSQRLPEAHVLDWRGRRRLGDAVSGSAGAQPGGRAGGGQRLSPGETAALTALPATPGVDPGLPLVFPGVLAKPPGVPINFLGDYSVCLFFFLFFPSLCALLQDGRGGIAQGKAASHSSKSTFILFSCSIVWDGKAPECFGPSTFQHSSRGACVWGIKVCQDSAVLLFLLYVCR